MSEIEKLKAEVNELKTLVSNYEILINEMERNHVKELNTITRVLSKKRSK